MSNQARPSTVVLRVCDLCGKPIDTYGWRDWARLNVGNREPNGDPKKLAIRFFRWRHGNRNSGAPDGDYREWEWDFHGECLVEALNPLVIEESKHLQEEA